MSVAVDMGNCRFNRNPPQTGWYQPRRMGERRENETRRQPASGKPFTKLIASPRQAAAYRPNGPRRHAQACSCVSPSR